MKIDEFDYSSKLTGISWNHSNVSPIRRFKNGDQLRTSDGTFEFDEETGWVRQELKADKVENTGSKARSDVEMKWKYFSDITKGKRVLQVEQEVIGEPPTLGRLLKLPDDSLYLYIGMDEEGNAEAAGAMLVSDICTDTVSLGRITFDDSEKCSCGEHICSCKCEGHCKDAKKSEKDKKDKKDDTLAGTVDGMLSNDYKERFIAEYVQLSVRLERMDALIKKMWTGRGLFDCDLNLFIWQLDAMIKYRDVLKMRADIEKINLPKCTEAEKFAVPTIRFM